MKAEYTEVAELVERLAFWTEKLRRENRLLATTAMREAADMLEAQAAKIAELEVALKPFASYSTPYINDPKTPDNGMPANTPHTVGEYRRARAALEGK